LLFLGVDALDVFEQDEVVLAFQKFGIDPCQLLDFIPVLRLNSFITELIDKREQLVFELD